MWKQTQWIRERDNVIEKQHLVCPSTFTEKCLDQHLINWFTQATATFFPQFKRIFVDEKDKELFE